MFVIHIVTVFPSSTSALTASPHTEDCDGNEAHPTGSASLAQIRGPQGRFRAPRPPRRRDPGLQRPPAADPGSRRKRLDLRADDQTHADAQVRPQRRTALAHLSGTSRFLFLLLAFEIRSQSFLQVYISVSHSPLRHACSSLFLSLSLPLVAISPIQLYLSPPSQLKYTKKHSPNTLLRNETCNCTTNPPTTAVRGQDEDHMVLSHQARRNQPSPGVGDQKSDQRPNV